LCFQVVQIKESTIVRVCRFCWLAHRLNGLGWL
jgi:hypothetical protein